MKVLVHFNSVQNIFRVEAPVLKPNRREAARKRVVVIAPPAASWAMKIH